MKVPTTQLDARFSDPDAVATTWDETRRVLEEAELFWISSVRTDGRPHVTPLVAVWSRPFCHRGWRTKALNIRSNPHVILTTGCNRWEQGIDVVVEGVAVHITDDRVLERLAETWAKNWDGRWQLVVRDGAFRHDDGEAALVFSVAPTKALAFAKGGFSHTRHLF